MRIRIGVYLTILAIVLAIAWKQNRDSSAVAEVKRTGAAYQSVVCSRNPYERASRKMRYDDAMTAAAHRIGYDNGELALMDTIILNATLACN